MKRAASVYVHLIFSLTVYLELTLSLEPEPVSQSQWLHCCPNIQYVELCSSYDMPSFVLVSRASVSSHLMRTVKGFSKRFL